MGARVSGEEASVYYLGAEPIETSSRWNLHWETEVTDFLATFENWLTLLNFDNAEWIRWQSVEMFFNECASEIQEAKKKGRGGNK